MAFFVAAGFLGQVFFKGSGQVNAGLIGQADENEQNVGHFVGQIDGFITFFEALVAILTSHDAGDFVLSQLASLFRKSIRDNDIACRLGGEEFGIMMYHRSPIVYSIKLTGCE